MEAVGIAAAVVSALVASLGFVWTISFGQRNLVDMMASSRQGKLAGMQRPQRAPQSPTPTSSAPSPAAAASGTNASPTNDHEPNKDESMTLYQRWLAITGMIVVGCWARGADFDLEYIQPLPVVTGCAMRWLLILPVGFLASGIFFTLVSLPFGTHSGGFEFGTGLLAAFLATLVTEFFIVGIISIVGFVMALVPDKALEQAMDAIED